MANGGSTESENDKSSGDEAHRYINPGLPRLFVRVPFIDGTPQLPAVASESQFPEIAAVSFEENLLGRRNADWLRKAGVAKSLISAVI